MKPRSLLARTFLLLGALVVVSTIGWLSLFLHVDAEPRARETAQLAASTVNLIRASLFAAAPEKRIGLFVELMTREGIRLLPAEAHDRVRPLPGSRFHDLLQQEVAARLGPRTRIAAAVNDEAGFWVSFRLDEQDDEEYWLILPRERARRSMATHWLSWGLLALLLALGAAGLIASRISRPLKAMASAAETLGRGQMPPPLPETGASELRAVAHAFNRMASDLERHEKERSEVLAGISHDLRTPLTRLRLEAEMSISSEQARQGVVADIEQMEAVISQFMDYARTEQGEPPESIDLAALLQGIADHQAAIGRALETIAIAPLPLTPLRPKAIRRAIDNVLDNAWKYGGGAISLRAYAVDRQICLEIADRGPGIPPDQAERLKRPFTRLETARTGASGTGLGLAIVERIVRLHGGTLELLAAPGGGLLARLTLNAA